MITALALRLLISALAIYPVLYLLLALLKPQFHHRFLSVLAAVERSARIWLVIPRALITVGAFGFLIYSATYPIVSAVPYSWGAHDEDGIWQSSRDELRLLISILGAFSLPFILDYVSEQLTLLRMERIARRSFIRALANDDGVQLRSLEIAAYRTGQSLQHHFAVTPVLTSNEILKLGWALATDVKSVSENGRRGTADCYDGR